MTTKKRMPKDRWEEIRAKWEADPRPGYVWIVTELSLGVSDIAVLQKAKREGWAKKASIKTIVQRAHLQADSKAKAKLSVVEKNVSADGKKVSARAKKVSEKVSALTEAESVEMRSTVLDRHRDEWRDHANRFKLSDMTGEDGFQVARNGKTAAEMVKIRQEGERKAWALDAIAEDTGTAKTLEELDAMFSMAMNRSQEMRDAVRKERTSHAAA